VNRSLVQAVAAAALLEAAGDRADPRAAVDSALAKDCFEDVDRGTRIAELETDHITTFRHQ